MPPPLKMEVKSGGSTHTYIGTNIQKNLIGQTVRPTGIETTHLIGLGFSCRRIQSEF